MRRFLLTLYTIDILFLVYSHFQISTKILFNKLKYSKVRNVRFRTLIITFYSRNLNKLRKYCQLYAQININERICRQQICFYYSPYYKTCKRITEPADTGNYRLSRSIGLHSIDRQRYYQGKSLSTNKAAVQGNTGEKKLIVIWKNEYKENIRYKDRSYKGT